MRIKVRAEEVFVGGILGVAAGVALTSPLTAGLPSYLPAGLGFSAAFKAALVFLAGGVGGIAGALLCGMQESEQHVRGVLFWRKTEEAERRMRGVERARFSAQQKAGDVRGVTIGGVELSRKREVGHLYCVGAVGSGKTVVLRAIIDQVLQRQDRLILHDPKGDLTAAYYDSATTVLLGPWDARATIWHAAADIDESALADEFASAVCGVADAGQNRFFHQSAAKLLAGIIKAYQKEGRDWRWADLGDILGGGGGAIVLAAVEGDPLVRAQFGQFLSSGQLGKGEDSILSTLASAVGWIRQLAAVEASQPDAPRFSVRAWLKGTAHSEVRTVIFNANSNYRVASAAIFGSQLAAAAAEITSTEMPERSADEPGIWMILDEFPQLGSEAIQHIQRAAEVGRSRGLREVLAMQDETQLAGLMGAEKSAPVLAVQNTRLYLRTSPQTAEAVSRRIGEREILLIETTAQAGAIMGKTMRPDKRQVLNPSDLMGLQELDHGIELLMHAEDRIGRLVQPFAPRVPDIAEKFEACQAWRVGEYMRPADEQADDGPTDAPEQTPAQTQDDDLPYDVPSHDDEDAPLLDF